MGTLGNDPNEAIAMAKIYQEEYKYLIDWWGKMNGIEFEKAEKHILDENISIYELRRKIYQKLEEHKYERSEEAYFLFTIGFPGWMVDCRLDDINEWLKANPGKTFKEGAEAMRDTEPGHLSKKVFKKTQKPRLVIKQSEGKIYVVTKYLPLLNGKSAIFEQFDVTDDMDKVTDTVYKNALRAAKEEITNKAVRNLKKNEQLIEIPLSQFIQEEKKDGEQESTKVRDSETETLPSTE